MEWPESLLGSDTENYHTHFIHILISFLVCGTWSQKERYQKQKTPKNLSQRSGNNKRQKK